MTAVVLHNVFFLSVQRNMEYEQFCLLTKSNFQEIVILNQFVALGQIAVHHFDVPKSQIQHKLSNPYYQL
jgi:hypothetical protein